MANGTHSLGTELVRATQKEAAMQRPLPMTVEARSALPSGASVEAKATLHDNDRFSHMAGEIKVRCSGSTPARPESAKTKAEKFCEKTTYLTERLQFVESDAKGNAVARSTPQTMRGPRAEYFEAKVGNNEISLQRFKPHENKPGREAVPFCVTDEVLERLADDAAGVLTSHSNKRETR